MTPGELLTLAERAAEDGNMEDFQFLMNQAEAAIRMEQDAQRQQSVGARPLPRAPVPPVVFQPPEQVRAQIRAGAREAAAVQPLARGRYLPSQTDIQSVKEAEAERIRQDIERQRQRVTQPGIEDPVSVAFESPLPLFRPSRITEEQAVTMDVGGVSPLLPAEQARELERRAIPVADVPAPTAPERLLESPVYVQRVYTDPTTGERRRPTALDEFTESFALQTEVSEERFREEQQRRAEAIEAGEASAYEEYIAPVISRVLTKPDQSRGLTETPLASLLRSTLGWVSAAAAEGYFSGLGYEVDENGVPLDPEDIGLAIAEARQALGIPDVVRVSPLALSEQARFYGERLGLEEETISTLENLFYSIPSVTIPTPGVATTRTQSKSTTYDPEGRRVVEDRPVRPLGQGFLKDEFQRISQNVAKGRTWGDEYLDSPAMVQHYASVYGDPDKAYLAGLASDVLLPTGLGVVNATTRGMGAVSRALGMGAEASRSRAVTAAVNEVATAQRQLESAQRLSRQATTPSQRLAARNRLSVRNERLRTAQTRLNQLETTRATPRIVTRVAERAARSVLPEADQTRVVQRLTDAQPATLLDIQRVLDDVGGLTAAQRGRILRLSDQNIPADFVMISDTVGVPRALASQSKAVLDDIRADTFVKPATDIISDVLALPLSPALRREAQRLVDDFQRVHSATPITGRGWSSLPTDIRLRAQRLVSRHSSEAGLNRTFTRAFDQRTPSQSAARLTGAPDIRQQLQQYDRWEDVPAALRRQFDAILDVSNLDALPAVARKAGDITRAQLYFRTAESGFRNTVNALTRGRRLSLGQRHLLALFPWLTRLETETLSAARAARNLDRLGTIVIRRLSRQLSERAKAPGMTFDRVLDETLELEARAAGQEPDAIWDAILGTLYGERKDDVVGTIIQNGLLGPGTEPATVFRSYPTVESLKGLDAALTSPRGGNLFVEPTIPVVQRFFAPDFQQAMIHTIINEGMKKALTADRVLLEAIQRADVPVEQVAQLVTRSTRMTEAEDIARQLQGIPSPRGVVEPLPLWLSSPNGKRVATYDTAASVAERELAAGADGLFRQLETIAPRERGDSARMVYDALSNVLFQGQRDFRRRVQYGYIVPKLPAQLGRIAQMALVPLATIGAVNTLKAAGRLAGQAGQRALNAVTRRRFMGGGLTDPAGVYYSPKTLDNLAENYGLGISQIESERVGSLAGDMIRAAKAAASDTPRLRSFLNNLNPMSKGYFLRMAEAAELNFRKSVFETLLAAGRTPEEAADVARRSQLDFADVPEAIVKFISPWMGEAAGLYQIAVQGLTKLIESPGTAARILKTQRLRAEEADPYNIYGDKALKSLGLIAKDQKTYYLPSLPIFAPAEAILNAARQGDLLVDDVRHAAEVAGLAGATYTYMDRGGELVLRNLADVAVPAVLDAYDRFQEGDGYQTTDVPGAEQMTDEKMFWAIMLAADNADPEREPGGRWDQFTTWFQPESQPPPPDASDPRFPMAWTRQPPEGVPHVYYGVTPDGVRLYDVLKPSKQGLINIKLARLLGADQIAAALPMYVAATKDDTPRQAPVAIYPSPLIPTDSVAEIIADQFLGSEVTSVPMERARQAERVRSISEEFQID